MDSELTVALIRLSYLALLWIMVIVCVIAIKSDIYGKVFSRKKTKTQEEKYQNTSRRLVIVEGSMKGTSIQLLQGQEVIIGRSPTCTLVINDTYASSRHVRIYSKGSRWIAEDMGSTNGTYIGTQRLQSPTTLRTGDTIRIGQTVIEMQK